VPYRRLTGRIPRLGGFRCRQSLWKDSLCGRFNRRLDLRHPGSAASRRHLDESASSDGTAHGTLPVRHRRSVNGTFVPNSSFVSPLAETSQHYQAAATCKLSRFYLRRGRCLCDSLVCLPFTVLHAQQTNTVSRPYAVLMSSQPSRFASVVVVVFTVAVISPVACPVHRRYVSGVVSALKRPEVSSTSPARRVACSACERCVAVAAPYTSLLLAIVDAVAVRCPRRRDRGRGGGRAAAAGRWRREADVTR
jgi:hypothetical protein